MDDRYSIASNNGGLDNVADDDDYDDQVWARKRRDQNTQLAESSTQGIRRPFFSGKRRRQREGVSVADDAREAHLGYNFDRFARPVWPLSKESPEVVAQLVCMTYDEAPSHEELARRAALRLPVLDQWRDAPVVRAVANTSAGHSVGISFYGFTPYCYLASNGRVGKLSAGVIAADLNAQLKQFCARNAFEGGVDVVRVEHASLTDMAGYQPHGACALLRVHVKRPSQIPRLRMFVQSHQPEGVLERDFEHPEEPGRVLRSDEQLRIGGHVVMARVWEANIKFTTRFQIDHEMLEQSWFALPANSYSADSGAFRCSVSLACDHAVVRSLGSEGDYSRYAPYRYLGVDIETYYRRGAKKDGSDPETRVINIACQVFAPSGQPVLAPYERLDCCDVVADAMDTGWVDSAVDVAPHPGTDWCDRAVVNVMFHLRSLNDELPANVDEAYGYGGDNDDDMAALASAEKQMLLDFARFVRAYDHDIWFWYNGDNFDLPTLLMRAKMHGIEREFCDMGRVPGRPMSFKQSTFKSKSRGTRDSFDITVPLRINFDLLRVVQVEFKLRKYPLRYVLEQFWLDAKPGEFRPEKDDLSYEEIPEHFDGTADTRRKLAFYAMRDVEVLRHILRKKRIDSQYLEISRLTSVPVDALITQGAQAKIHTLLALFAKRNNYALPTLYFTPQEERARDEEGATKEKYQGATVLEPARGFYHEHPVGTLDYSGLYPSLMMAHNLCPTTLCSLELARELNAREPGTCVRCDDTGAWYVTAKRSKGVMPRILEGLTAARGFSKKRAATAKAAKDMDTFNEFDVRQLAIKVIANSAYGFLGVPMGRFGYPIIAATVTAYGRLAIDMAKRTVESEEASELMRARGVTDTRRTVIYGDTDSVMVHLESLDGQRDMALAMDICKDMAKLTTSKMPKPIELLWEKIYYPYLLIEPKNYVGQLWTKPDKPDYTDVKGLETKKRDTPPFVERAMNAAIKKLMGERSAEAACAMARRELVALRTDALPIGDYEITKSFGKAPSEYAAPHTMPHLWVLRKLEHEREGSGPIRGDRVPFVIARDDNEPSHTARAIDPDQMRRLGMCVDRHYYETRKFVNPLCRLLDIPLGGAEGATMRAVFEHPETQQYRLTVRSGGMMRYMALL